MARYVGPCEIDCPLKCSVPSGYTLAEVPPPRHDWADVKWCPNDEESLPPEETCGKVFLVSEA